MDRVRSLVLPPKLGDFLYKLAAERCITVFFFGGLLKLRYMLEHPKALSTIQLKIGSENLKDTAYFFFYKN
jgi:hypothetical protein